MQSQSATKQQTHFCNDKALTTAANDNDGDYVTSFNNKSLNDTMQYFTFAFKRKSDKQIKIKMHNIHKSSNNKCTRIRKKTNRNRN